MSFKTKFSSAAAIAAVTCAGFANAATFILPTPENNANATYGVYLDAMGTPRQAILMNGIPVAFKYDDFWSYSGKVLAAMQTQSPALIPSATFGTYTFSTGTGTIDINVSSVSQGATNIVDLGGGKTLQVQDPVALSSNQNVLGWTCTWGGTTQSCTNYGGNDGGYTSSASNQGGTTTVGSMLAYLQSLNPLWSIPIIYADYSQSKSDPGSLWVSAKVEIVNPDTGMAVASWQLDRDTNNTWDQSAPTFNFGNISFEGSATNCDQASELWNPVTGKGCAGVTTNGETYKDLDHNTGSGKADFLVYADTMDLSLFDPKYLFVITANVGCIPNTTAPWIGTDGVGCNSGGGEEFGIIGGLGSTKIPEPGSIALTGLALSLIGLRRRNKLS